MLQARECTPILSSIFIFGFTFESFKEFGVCQLKVKSLCKNHVLRALHNSFIGSFCNYILLWRIQNIYLSLDSIIAQKIIKLFGHKPYFIVESQGLDLHVGFIFHQCLICLEFVKHLSFHF